MNVYFIFVVFFFIYILKWTTRLQNKSRAKTWLFWLFFSRLSYNLFCLPVSGMYLDTTNTTPKRNFATQPVSDSCSLRSFRSVCQCYWLPVMIPLVDNGPWQLSLQYTCIIIIVLLYPKYVIQVTVVWTS